MSRFLYPTINGISPDWACIAIRMTPTGGTLVEMGNIKSIKSSRKREVGRQREGGRTIKRTIGQIDYEAELELYLDGYHQLIDALSAGAPTSGNQKRLGLATFLINQQWSVPNDSRIFERRIKGCMLMGDSLDASEGTDAQTITLPLDPIEIADVKDGVEYVLI
jgi:hypothetical protein